MYTITTEKIIIISEQILTQCKLQISRYLKQKLKAIDSPSEVNLSFSSHIILLI